MAAEAAVQILLPIAAVAFGMTIFGLAFLFAVPHLAEVRFGSKADIAQRNVPFTGYSAHRHISRFASARARLRELQRATAFKAQWLAQ